MRTLFLSLALVAAPLAMLVQTDDPPARPVEGDTAPTARVNDQTGHAANLGGDHSDDNSNWTVLAFFPKAATPG
ncbi:MAG: hypothetical protein ACI8QS_002203 [Planctomycetota bacterium]|jgi:hypothetical protein